MSKQVKIKRYNRIYGTKKSARRKRTSILLGIAVVLLLLVGWASYKPVKKFLSGERPVSEPVREESSKPVQSTVISQDESGVVTSEDPVLPDTSEDDGSVNAVYLPADRMTDPSKLQAFISSVKDTGTDTVLIELKDSTGTVWFRSGNEKAAPAVSENAVDLVSLVKTLGQNGFQVWGRIHAFKDPLAARNLSDAAVKYMDSGINWLDNSAELGGKPWLNPYSDEACGYISDLAVEAVDAGVECIILDSVQFPDAAGSQYAAYGSAAENVSKADRLAAFISDTVTKVAKKGARISIAVSAEDAVRANFKKYGGSPLNIGNAGAAADLALGSLSGGFSYNGREITDPAADTGKTVPMLLGAVKDVFGVTPGRITAFIPADGNDASLAGKRTEAAEAFGCAGSVIYSSSGQYALK